MSLFDDKQINPMLIGIEAPAFDAPDYIYELKLDGERAIVYLDKSGTELRNKRNKRMLSVFPELNGIHKQVNKRCILDGEYVTIVDGKPQFSEIQRRSLMSNPLKIELAAKKYPVSFVAFDILFCDEDDVTKLPLLERKALLNKVVKSESERLSVSRIIEQYGIALYDLAEKQHLEGIVAKEVNSKYYFGKRTKEWIKCKALLDDDFVICGYIHKSNHMTSLVLGQYKNGQLIYKGHVTMGISKHDFSIISSQEEIDRPDMHVPEGHGNENAVWIKPELVCTVEFMEYTSSGGMRQARYKGLRPDKNPEECVVN